MRDIIQCMNVLCKLPNNPIDSATVETDSQKAEVKDSSGTQTEIIAVHTPQVENLPFPFLKSTITRPSTLLLVDSSDNAVLNISEKDGGENAEVDPKSELDSASTSKKDETPEKLNPKKEENEEPAVALANSNA